MGICACGCEEVIPDYDKRGRIITFKKGHCNRSFKFFQKNDIIPCTCCCGEKINKYTKNNIKKKYKVGHNSKGSTHPQWKGGRRKTGGYWRLWLPQYELSKKNETILEHVYFYQEYHKCCVCKWSVVHHIDGNKENNMPWNLIALSRKEHQRIHRIKNMSDRFCSNCNLKTYVTKDGHANWHKDGKGGFLCHICSSKSRRHNLKGRLVLSIKS